MKLTQSSSAQLCENSTHSQPCSPWVGETLRAGSGVSCPCENRTQGSAPLQVGAPPLPAPLMSQPHPFLPPSPSQPHPFLPPSCHSPTPSCPPPHHSPTPSCPPHVTAPPLPAPLPITAPPLPAPLMSQPHPFPAPPPSPPPPLPAPLMSQPYPSLHQSHPLLVTHIDAGGVERALVCDAGVANGVGEFAVGQ
ncbi:hypothetical protein JZ751_005778 [Albula glossodonta]|uniref:Uncharacterized protein n=1 Tax=Albula glossodonta TaxID=121402 RepID=A0A8T2MY35_9TELE|nr:hypothetical protein JZ751_005778 [Albula glossodonta]